MRGELLFVYGTLRRGMSIPVRWVLEKQGEFVSRAWLQGKLYEVAGYPGAIPAGDAADRILGDLFRLLHPVPVLDRLDVYEGCCGSVPTPHEFVRDRLPVELPGGAMVTAWVYVFNRDTAALQRILSGDYLAWCARGAGNTQDDGMERAVRGYPGN